MFNLLKKLYPGTMVEFHTSCGIGKRRSMIGGNFTGVELKILIKEKNLANLAKVVPNGLEITQYLRSLRELHKMCVKKEFSEDYQAYIDTFHERFKVMRELKLASFTTKSHIILSHIGQYMLHTGQSLYTADTSPTESAHSGFKTCQKAHNMATTHNLGSPGHQLRLKRSMMRFNWNNLPFDLREPETEDFSPGDAAGEGEANQQEDLDLYIQHQQEEVVEADECGACDHKQVESQLLNIVLLLLNVECTGSHRVAGESCRVGGENQAS